MKIVHIITRLILGGAQENTLITCKLGIRLAIGALEREVLMQFLVEAVVLSSFGGIIGIGVAVAASFGFALWNLAKPSRCPAQILIRGQAFPARNNTRGEGTMRKIIQR